MAVLFEHREEFDERNAFLQVVLGLIACAREVEAVLPLLEDGTARRYGAAAPSLRLDVPETPSEDHEVVHFLLGLASLSRTVMHHAEQNASAPSREPSSRAQAAQASLRSLLEV